MTAEEIAKVLEDQVSTLNYPSLDGYEIVDRVQDRLSAMAKAVRELADSGDVSSDLPGPTFAIVFLDQTYVLVDRGEARVDAIKAYVRAADLHIASLQRSIEGHRGDKEKLLNADTCDLTLSQLSRASRQHGARLTITFPRD